MTYNDSPMTEAQAQGIDSGQLDRTPTLAEYERRPATAEALANVRCFYTRERMAEMADRPETIGEQDRRNIGHVWQTMGGETCFNDALRLLARRH